MLRGVCLLLLLCAAVLVDAKSDANQPEQIHISLGDSPNSMVVSWVTAGNVPTVVQYGLSSGAYTQKSVGGPCASYTVGGYTSGCIHATTLSSLTPATTYFYRCGDGANVTSDEFSFSLPPATGGSTPLTLGVVGDLGQTSYSKMTVANMQKNTDISLIIHVGDLSYADSYQPRWDTWGKLIQPEAATKPWMVCPGNHEIEEAKEGKFVAYQKRFFMPSASSGATEGNLYYSFNAASVHVISLCSYCDYSHDSAQFKWLQKDLQSINRQVTPWVLVQLHAPWYNSNKAHHNETEEYGMRESMEKLLRDAAVDVVFAGHVHAYERIKRVFNYELTDKAPIYITIGDGGNREGLASKWNDPQPYWSEVRKASYGFGKLQIANSTHALWTWWELSNPQAGDSLWITHYSP